MFDNTDAEIRNVYENWNKAVVARDLNGLMELYADNSVLETPLILATLRHQNEGVLKGKEAISSFFAASFRSASNGLGRWYRTGTFFSNGRQLVWEYPRAAPEGDQVDLVEVMDLHRGLITHHRVYWGWVGYNALLATWGKPAS